MEFLKIIKSILTIKAEKFMTNRFTIEHLLKN